jgi:hypothetical protein
MRAFIAVLVGLFFISLTLNVLAAGQESDINFTYLDSMRGKVILPRQGECTAWLSYDSKAQTSARPYRASAEDTARIALLYCRYFEKEGASSAVTLKKIRESIEILGEMQDNNGFFYPSIAADGTLEKRPAELSETFDLSTAYAFWAIARGYRIIDKQDPALAKKWADRLDKVVARLRALDALPNKGYNKFTTVHGMDVPAWFISDSSSLTSVVVMGLLEYYAASPRGEVKELIHRYCTAMSRFSGASYEEFPFGAHYQNVQNMTAWTLRNSWQISAMAIAGAKMGEPSWIESAEREANGLYTHFVASFGPLCAMAPGPVIYPQTPEIAEVMVSNLMTLNALTGRENYAVMAGITASWLLGNNQRGEIIYDRATGKGFNYLDALGKSKDAGLSSTAASLLTFTELWNTPAMEYTAFRDRIPSHTFMVLEAEEGKAVRKDYEIEECIYPGGSQGKYVSIKRENSFWIKFEVTRENDYDFYLVYLKQPGLTMGTSIMMRIDGDRIFTVPLGGSPDMAYLAMKEVVEPRLLLPGLHSLGIRFSGLLHTNAATIDSVILQPAIEWRILSDNRGHSLVFLKSFIKDDREFKLDRLELKNFCLTSYTLYHRSGTVVIKKQENGLLPMAIKIPAYGYAVMMGK